MITSVAIVKKLRAAFRLSSIRKPLSPRGFKLCQEILQDAHLKVYSRVCWPSSEEGNLPPVWMHAEAQHRKGDFEIHPNWHTSFQGDAPQFLA